MSVSVEFSRCSSGEGRKYNIHTALGTRVFMEDGTEIKDISAISMPETSVDNILCITLTIPIHDIKFVD